MQIKFDKILGKLREGDEYRYRTKTLTFNADGSLNSCTDSTGSETIVYTTGLPSSVTGTGAYSNKTLTYTETLDAVTI
jgi:hypothetical protein